MGTIPDFAGTILSKTMGWESALGLCCYKAKDLEKAAETLSLSVPACIMGMIIEFVSLVAVEISGGPVWNVCVVVVAFTLHVQASMAMSQLDVG